MNSASASEQESANAENMRVIVRMRPNLPGDASVSVAASTDKSIIVDERDGKVQVARDKKGLSEFSFSDVLNEEATQKDLYSLCSGIVADVMGGINCCIFA